MINFLPTWLAHARLCRCAVLVITLASAATLMTACSSGSSGGGDAGGGGGGTPSFTVGTSAGDGGSLSPASTSVTQGGTATFTITTLASHTLVDVTGCGGTLSGNAYTTGAITGACTVTATFELRSYTVTTSADEGGSISPASAAVDHGDTAQFAVTADAGFTLDTVTGCGGSLDGETWTTGPITDDCSVQASFAPIDGTPTQVSAVAGNEQVTVSWGGVDSATAYNVYWSSTPDIDTNTSASFDGLAEGVASPHTVTGLTNEATYHFVVTAMFEAVEGAASSEVSATPTDVTGSGLIRTTTHLIDVEAGLARRLHMPTPVAFTFLGNEMFVIPSALSTTPRRLWRFNQATGEVENVMEAGLGSTVLHHLLSAAPDGELIRLNESTTFIAVNPQTLSSREFSNPDLAIVVDADFTVAGNGNIVGKGSNTVVVMDRDGNTLATSGEHQGVSALARTPDGRVVGIRGAVSMQGTTQTTIVEIDATTAQVTVLGSVPEVQSSGGSLQRVRLAAGNDGYFVSESRTSDPGSIFFVDGDSFAATELAMPDGVEVQGATTMHIGPDGHLYARMGDRRASTSGAISVLMRFTLTGDEPEIALAGSNNHIRYSAVGPDGDLFNYASGLLSTGRILRQDRITGGLTLVAHDAALVNGYNLTVDGNDIYVISTRPDGEHLVHVDIPSGTVTELSALGAPPTGEDRWFVNTLAPDPLSNDVILGSAGGLASVARLATTPGNVPQIIASQFVDGAPRDLKIRPNGDIFFLNDGGIRVVNPFTGSDALVVAHAAEIDNALALVDLDDGRFVVFDNGTGDGQTLWLVDPATGQTQDLLIEPPPPVTSGGVVNLGWPHLFRIP